MFLRANTDILKINIATAADLEINIDAIQVDASTPPVVQAFLNYGPRASETGTGDVSIIDVTGLTSGHNVKVKRVSIYNNHASAATVLTVFRYDGTNNAVECKVNLLAGEGLVYNEGDWTHYDLNAAPYSPNVPLDVCLRVTADQAFATAVTLADITDLGGVALKNGKKYAIELCLFTTNNASTTGSQFAINGPAATTFVAGEFGASTNAAVTGVIAAGSATAINTIIISQTTGQTAVGMHRISAYYEPSADGTLAIRAASEISVAAGLTVKKGSWMRVREISN